MQAAPNHRHFDGGQEKIPEEIVVAFWEMQPIDVCRELGYRTTTDLLAAGLAPWEVWLPIKCLQTPVNLGQLLL